MRFHVVLECFNLSEPSRIVVNGCVYNRRFVIVLNMNSSQQPLRYGFETAGELLEKLNRDRSALYAAINSQCDIQIADAIFNFVVTGFSIRDWVKDETGEDVHKYIRDTRALAACADLSLIHI